jgi:molecular chaperone DnaK (HSP70)
MVSLRNITLTAATRAGIPEDMLFLVTEPEAAALYYATLWGDVNLGQRDKFVVCDAGGGTFVYPSLEETF